MYSNEYLVPIEFTIEDSDQISTELIPAKFLGNNLYELSNGSFFIFGVSKGDLVEATLIDAHHYPKFTRVTQKSGFKTIRIFLEQPIHHDQQSKKTIADIEALGCILTSKGSSLYTVNIPPEVALITIRDYMMDNHIMWEHADPRYDELYD